MLVGIESSLPRGGPAHHGLACFPSKHIEAPCCDTMPCPADRHPTAKPTRRLRIPGSIPDRRPIPLADKPILYQTGRLSTAHHTHSPPRQRLSMRARAHCQAQAQPGQSQAPDTARKPPAGLGATTTRHHALPHHLPRFQRPPATPELWRAGNQGPRGRHPPGRLRPAPQGRANHGRRARAGRGLVPKAQEST